MAQGDLSEPVEALQAWLRRESGWTTFAPMWGARASDWAVFAVAHRDSEVDDRVVLLHREGPAWVFHSARDDLGFLPYDGLPAAYPEDGPARPGVVVSDWEVQDDVSEIRLFTVDESWVESSVGGRWYFALFGVDMWMGSWPWPEFGGLRLESGDWVDAIAPDDPFTPERRTAMVVDDWIKYHRQGLHGRSEDDDEEWWALEYMDQARGDLKWALIRAVVDAAPDDEWILGMVGAGPLEDFLGFVAYELAAGDERWLRRVEEAAAASTAFREALEGAVWPDDPPELWRRLSRVVGDGNQRQPPPPPTEEEEREIAQDLGLSDTVAEMLQMLDDEPDGVDEQLAAREVEIAGRSFYPDEWGWVAE